MTAVVQEGIRWSVMIKSVWGLAFRLFGGAPVFTTDDDFATATLWLKKQKALIL